MRTTVNVWRVLTALALVAIGASALQAASARGLAVARAFQYAYNNPQLGPGEGPLGSSIYTGGGSGSRGPIAVNAAPTGNESVLANQVRSVQMYTPMAPVSLSSADGANLSGYAAYMNPFRDMSSALDARDAQGMSIRSEKMTSLAPKTPGEYRDAMLQGESLMRQGKLQDAADSFEKARKLSSDSAESLLSLSHVYFAMGTKGYDKAAEFLAKTLEVFPDLLTVRVRPQEFYASEEDFAKNAANLDEFVKANPKDAPAMLLQAYIQYRQGQLDKASPTLKAVMALGPAKEIADGVYAMQDGITQIRQFIQSEAPKLLSARNYAWAGIGLAVPEGFKPIALNSPNQVLLGTVQDPLRGGSYQISLYAYALAEDMKLKAFMDFMSDSLKQSPSLKNMETDAEVEVPFQTGRALVRVFTYEVGSARQKTTMGWVAFSRDSKEKGVPRIGYMLGVAMNEVQADQLLPTLVAISKTVTLTAPVSPSASALAKDGQAVEDRQFGFTMFQPEGWSGRQTDKGYEMGQMDFIRGAIIPRVEVMAQTVAATYTAQSMGEEAIQKRTPKGFIRTILSKGPAKLDGQDGYQFVVSQKPETGAAGAETILAGRLILLDLGNGSKMMFALVVNGGTMSAKEAEAFTETASSFFKLMR